MGWSTEAVQLFNSALEQCPKSSIEYDAAAAELNRIAH
ncbi:hypothetical protein ACVIHI_008538 [Bradyrhizobium sp. USDA 4524]|nr:hypothetical protein [Bradyrhizobium sp. USDA 4538]MCP1907365.1 hypothetical protein [Bradyrhizobium sp. USDA 4537]MCP1985151.1 hypothetical protein [Bradyrhizobium sp. USDA 4539]